jgi:hypothetical protein
LGTTSVMATDQLKIALPVAAADPGNMLLEIGLCILGHNGTYYEGRCYINFADDTTNDRMRLASVDTSGSYGVLANVATSVPFAWSAVNTDEILGTIKYEAAS